MTRRALNDSFSPPTALGILPIVAPTAASARRSIDIGIDNHHRVPANYSVVRLRRSGRIVPGLDVAHRRAGIADRRTLHVPIIQASIQADHLITIRTGRWTSKLVFDRESLASALERGGALMVQMAVAATGAVRFSVRWLSVENVLPDRTNCGITVARAVRLRAVMPCRHGKSGHREPFGVSPGRRHGRCPTPPAERGERARQARIKRRPPRGATSAAGDG